MTDLDRASLDRCFPDARRARLGRRDAPLRCLSEPSPPASSRARRGGARRRRRNRLCDRQRARLHPRPGLHRPAPQGGDAEHARERRTRPPLVGEKRDPCREDPSFASGCMPTAESSGAGTIGPRIPEGASELTSGYLEQRLTPAGVELLRSEVLDSSKAVALHSRSGSSSRRCSQSGEFSGVEVRDGDRPVRPRWEGSDTDSIGEDEPAATPEQLAALQKIDALLTNSRRCSRRARGPFAIRAYVPSHYAVCIRDVTAERCVSAPLPPADAGRGSAPRQEPDKLRGRPAGPTSIRCRGTWSWWADRSRTAPSSRPTRLAKSRRHSPGATPDPDFHSVVLAYRLSGTRLTAAGCRRRSRSSRTSPTASTPAPPAGKRPVNAIRSRDESTSSPKTP